MERNRGILNGALCAWLGLVVLGAFPDAANAELLLSAGLGTQVCLPDGEADCEEVFPLGYVKAGLEYRFLTFIGLGVDYNLGGLVAEKSAISISTQQLIPMLRGYFPLSVLPLRLSAGAGMGFGEIWAQHDEESAPFYSFASLFTVLRAEAGVIWDLPLGFEVAADLGLLFHFSGERCFEHSLGQSDCAQVGELPEADAAVFDLLQLGGVFRYGF